MLKRLFLGLGLMLSMGLVQAQTLEKATFEDQHGESLALTPTTQWMVFSYDKSGGDWVRQAFDDLSLMDIETRGGLYVADISAMPGIITSLFALPKMRKYDFRIALDRSGELTANWPKQEGTVSLMRLNGLDVIEITYANSPEQIKSFLAAY